MMAKGSRDVKALLQHLCTCTWKSAPRLEVLLQSADLYERLFRLCRNTIMGHTTLALAFATIHKNKPCIYSAELLHLECACLAQTIRIGASKWRTIKQSSNSLRILLATADTAQCARLQKVLAIISTEKRDSSPGAPLVCASAGPLLPALATPDPLADIQPQGSGAETPSDSSNIQSHGSFILVGGTRATPDNT